MQWSKRESLETRLAALTTDYDTLSVSISNEIDAVSKNRHKRRLDEIDAEMHEIGQKLKVLDSEYDASPASKGLQADLPHQGRGDLDESIRVIFIQLAERVSVEEIQSVCRRSAALPDLDWPKGKALSGYCAWLLNKGISNTGRHPLYDVLALLKTKSDVLQCQLIHCTMQRLATYYPGLVTDPLAEPAPTTSTGPAVIEIVFEPRGTSDAKTYDVHSFWHPPDGERSRAGPRREQTDGGRLDPASPDQIGSYVGDLMVALDDWEFGDSDEIVFLFRLPTELLLHPVEHWPKNEFGVVLGRQHVVVVAPRERPHLQPCRKYWQRLMPRMREPVQQALWYIPHKAWPAHVGEQAEILAKIEQSACAALTSVPELGEPKHVLAGLIVNGVAVACWPRTLDAEPGFREILDECLGAEQLANLPYALRDLRKADQGREDASAVRHLTLLWDDPNRRAHTSRHGRFFSGVA